MNPRHRSGSAAVGCSGDLNHSVFSHLVKMGLKGTLLTDKTTAILNHLYYLLRREENPFFFATLLLLPVHFRRLSYFWKIEIDPSPSRINRILDNI